MPTEQELSEYAKKLPLIYRDIMTAFPAVEPGRKAGYGLAFQTLTVHFINTRREYSFGDAQEACNRLAAEGFLEIKHEIFAHPTPLGEELIATLTEKPPASSASLPLLPARTWQRESECSGKSSPTSQSTTS